LPGAVEAIAGGARTDLCARHPHYDPQPHARGDAAEVVCARTDEGQKSEPDLKSRNAGDDGSKSLQMAGATGLEPATFGVTGRTKFNVINDSCNHFCG